MKKSSHDDVLRDLVAYIVMQSSGVHTIPMIVSQLRHTFSEKKVRQFIQSCLEKGQMELDEKMRLAWKGHTLEDMFKNGA